MEDIIAEMAKLIIKQNEPYIGKEVKNKAIDDELADEYNEDFEVDD